MIKTISTKKSWIEGTAIQQLEKLHELHGVQSAVGLPDLHAGPVGVAVSSKDIIYPHIVGSDAGCGMALFQTDGAIRKAKIDKWVKRLKDLDDPFEGELDQLLRRHGIENARFQSALGTVGLGNHFAELQKVHEIHNRELFEQHRFQKECFALLVHSGSRGFGRWIFDSHIEKNGSTGLHADSPEGKEYLNNHDFAVTWGRANRELIASRFLRSLGMASEQKLDLTHNSVTKELFHGEELWVHRKGANPNNQGIAVIAGSRGTLNYLVKPVGDLASVNYSIAHGAGRKLKRSEMEKRLRGKYSAASLTHTALGGRVICDDKKLLFEEAPEAYKSIEQVIADLKEFGLIEVIASYTPVITYKTRGRR